MMYVFMMNKEFTYKIQKLNFCFSMFLIKPQCPCSKQGISYSSFTSILRMVIKQMTLVGTQRTINLVELMEWLAIPFSISNCGCHRCAHFLVIAAIRCWESNDHIAIVLNAYYASITFILKVIYCIVNLMGGIIERRNFKHYFL